ncbi:magnesium transporter CorA family protein [Falsibacillus pallidus]|nr:magnesium transporter CorA family protein [Falsibacillus pallidus]
MNTFRGNEWTWIRLDVDEKEKCRDYIDPMHWRRCREWFDGIGIADRNDLRMVTEVSGQECLFGSFVYRQDLHEKDDFTILHFYLTRNTLVTVNLNPALIQKTSMDQILRLVKSAEDAIDAFFILQGELMNEFLYGIDEFETKLRELIWKFYNDNGTHILEQIHKHRHELLVLKGLIHSVKENQFAVEEAFLIESGDRVGHERTARRVKRGSTLIAGYEEEIENLYHSEEVVSSYRGNEITKALTIFTTIFTPMTALGAIWGMNFKHMPELDWKYGYAASLVLIFALTVLIYLFLQQKGWTGDLLKKKKRKSFYK